MILLYNDVADTIIEKTNENNSKLEEWFDKALDWIVAKGVLILLTLLFLYIGSKVIKLILKITKKAFERRKISESVTGFLISFFRIVLYVLLYISAAALLGFQVTSFVTLLGASGITIGLALQGSLSNLAGGVLILILKPFDIGDYIMENNSKCEGTVVGIDIFYTKLRTIDNRIVVIPNGNLSNTSIINYSQLGERVVEVKVGIAYRENMSRVRRILEEAVMDNEYIIEEREVTSFVDDFKESSVLFAVRFWVKSSNYFPAKWAATENVKKRLDEEGITIPFNQLEVKINQ
ncbi:MAG TPA: small-conductance mechanosensitive channel [Lachnospiraceae bacterium]|nr:small-conductance mechanosensitive channel [Lachnospiraceae bacterium]